MAVQADAAEALGRSRVLGGDVVAQTFDHPGCPADQSAAGGHGAIAIGAHGRSPFGRLLHGGVARDLAGGSRCPVVAVVRSRDAERGER